eukprot:745597-Pyramimonas_sp.AAC.1
MGRAQSYTVTDLGYVPKLRVLLPCAGGADPVPAEGGGHHSREGVRDVPQAHLQLGVRRVPRGDGRALQLHPELRGGGSHAAY